MDIDEDIMKRIPQKQLEVLIHIRYYEICYFHQGISMKELSEKMDRCISTVVQHVQALYHKGYLVKEQEGRFPRNYRVSLTGLKLLAKEL